MAKKDKKKDKQKGSDATEAIEAVRSAVERTFQATTEGAANTSKRTRNLVDEIAAAGARIKETIDDLRILEDVRGLRAEIEGLTRRVAALEVSSKAPTPPAPAKRRQADDGEAHAGQANSRQAHGEGEGSARQAVELGLTWAPSSPHRRSSGPSWTGSSR